MNKAALILALAIALPAWAQAPAQAEKAPEKPAAQEPAQAPEKAAKSEAPAPRKSGGGKHSRRMQDARHCLDEPTNTAIIKCAEAYL